MELDVKANPKTSDGTRMESDTKMNPETPKEQWFGNRGPESRGREPTRSYKIGPDQARLDWVRL